jgi:hypothetical protein
LRHSKSECDALKAVDADPASVFNFVFPLRLAILRQADRHVYDQVLMLEHHLEERLEQVSSILPVTRSQFKVREL